MKLIKTELKYTCATVNDYNLARKSVSGSQKFWSGHPGMQEYFSTSFPQFIVHNSNFENSEVKRQSFSLRKIS